MKNFGYCIWYMPTKQHKWYKLTKGFQPHISIRTDLTLNAAKELYNTIDCKSITVILENKLSISREKGFYAAYYNTTQEESLSWWPKNPHVSFAYKYSDFSPEEIDNLKNITPSMGKFDTIKIVKCIGHYKDWEFVN